MGSVESAKGNGRGASDKTVSFLSLEIEALSLFLPTLNRGSLSKVLFKNEEAEEVKQKPPLHISQNDVLCPLHAKAVHNCCAT
jgi:hypothetical protein